MQPIEPRHIKALLDQVRFDQQGLIAAIAQDHYTHQVLMLAWMNREALEQTLNTGTVVYYSRSRQALWAKGEQSGQTQRLIDLRLDCDRDAALLSVEQTGVACHTGRMSCFSWGVSGATWSPLEEVLISPESLYGGNP